MLLRLSVFSLSDIAHQSLTTTYQIGLKDNEKKKQPPTKKAGRSSVYCSILPHQVEATPGLEYLENMYKEKGYAVSQTIRDGI